ncbi:MAG: DNA polymerase III subunit beta [bacterium]
MEKTISKKTGMKLVFNKDELLYGLQIVLSAIATKTTLPVLSNFLIEVKDNVIKLFSTNLEISVQTTIKGEILGEGEVTIPAKKFIEIIKELPSDSEINITADESLKIDVHCGKIYFSMKGLSREEFPVIPEFGSSKTIVMQKKALDEMFKKTIFAVSTDETRYVLNGLYLVIKEGKLVIVATDGRRLALIEDQIAEQKIDKSVIVPSRTINELVKLFANVNDEEEIKIQLLDNQIAFRFDNTVVFSRLVEGVFPNYEQVIPKSSAFQLSINRDELLAVTKRAALCVMDKGGSVKYNITKGKLLVAASAHSYVEYKDELDINYSGTSIEIAFNPVYLLDVLKNIDSKEVFFEFSSSVNPGVIKPTNNNKFIYIIMPMKIS